MIDSHAHIGCDIYGKFYNILNFNGTPQEQDVNTLIKKLDKYQIERAIIYPFPSPLAQFGKDEFWYKVENTYLVDSWKKYPSRLIPIPAFHPKDSQSIEYALSLVKEYSLKGLKLHTRPTQISPSQLRNTSLMDTICDYQLTLVIHIGSNKEPELKEKDIDISLENAIQLARLYPDIKFIFAHLGRLHSSLRKALDLENVIIDTAALSVKEVWDGFLSEKYEKQLAERSSTEIIEHLVDLGYEDKIIWGTDEPYGISYQAEMDYILKARINEKRRSKIVFYNIRKFLGLCP